MKSPWLDIPLADYEAHMSLPAIGQAQLLSDVLEKMISRYRPRSVALLGCAGGNGLDRVARMGVERVVAVDINPDYVRCTEARFSGRIPGLELVVGDLEKDDFSFAPVDLAFGGLLFEYLDPLRALCRIRMMLRPGGALAAVLQLASKIENVTPSPYGSLASLAAVLNLVSPQRFKRLAADAGFAESDAEVLDSAGGKRFLVQVLTRDE